MAVMTEAGKGRKGEENKVGKSVEDSFTTSLVRVVNEAFKGQPQACP